MSLASYFLSFLLYGVTIAAGAVEELPLAPYNVKLFCHSGARNLTKTSTKDGPIECPSSSTSCGYIEFETKDPGVKTGKVGVFECVDSGILLKENNEYDEDIESEDLFGDLCGAVPRCSVIHLRALNTNFLKYVIATQNIKLKMIAKPTVKFCCALYHSTLNRLVNSGMDQLASVSASPVQCGGLDCQQGAIGCLLHSRYGKRGEFDARQGDKERKTKEKVDNSEEEGDYVEEYEVDEPQLIPAGSMGRLSTNLGEKREKRRAQGDDEDQIKAVEISFGDDEDTYLKGMDVIEYEEVPSGTEDGKSTKKEVILLKSGGPGPRPTAEKYTSLEDDDYVEDEGDHHCVYRHLNDEKYRYCLLIHSEKDGDRCYEHKGHSICCCFVPPDQNTCDPTDLDLVVPAPSLAPKRKLTTTRIPVIRPDTGLSEDQNSWDAGEKGVHLEAATTKRPPRVQIPATRAPKTTTTTTPAPTTSITSTTTTTVMPKRRKGRPRITATAPSTPNVRSGCRIVYPGPRRNDGKPKSPQLVCSSAFLLENSWIHSIVIVFIAQFLSVL